MIGVRASAAPAAAILAALAIGAADRAEAYTYSGPQSVVAACADQPDCTMDSGQFAGVRLTGDWVDTKYPVLNFRPDQPAARGGTTLTNVNLYLMREGSRLLLTVVRSYSEASGRSYAVPYRVTDPLLANVGLSDAVRLDLTVYMSKDQAWIESREGSGDLARVWTVPLFFGFGPNDGNAVLVQQRHGTANVSTTYYQVAPSALIADLNANYAKLFETTPFLFRGARPQGAALTASVTGADR